MATSRVTSRPHVSVAQRRHELRHRAQSMMEEAEPFEDHSEEEYETEIPEEQEDVFVEEELAHLAEEVIEYTNMARGIVAETVLGFIMVSLLQQVKPALWLKTDSRLMCVAHVLALLSPVLSARRHLLPYLSHPCGQALLRLVCLAGIFSLKISGSLFSTLLVMAGQSAAMLSLCSAWWSLSARKRTLSFWGLVLGMFVNLSFKVFHQSNSDPLFVDLTTNRFGILAGLLATADRLVTTYGKSHSHRSPLDKIIVDWTWLLVGPGFGGLLFLSQWLFGDISESFHWAFYYSSTSILWRIMVVLAMATGVFFSKHNILVLNWLWVPVTSLASVTILLSVPVLTQIGGLTMCVFIMATWPAIVDRVTCRSPTRTLILSMVVYMTFAYLISDDTSRHKLSAIAATACLFIEISIQCTSSSIPTPYSNNIGMLKKKDSITNSSNKMHAIIEEEEEEGSEAEEELRDSNNQNNFSKTAFPLLDGDQYLFFRTHVRPVLLIIVAATTTGLVFTSSTPP